MIKIDNRAKRKIIPKSPLTVVVNKLSPEANHRLHVFVAMHIKQIQLKKANEESEKEEVIR